MNEFEQIESSQRQHHNEIQHQMKQEVLETEQQFQIFSMLKPKIYPDGDMWCCLYGEDIVSGVVGFGSTPLKAILDFNNSFNEKIKVKV